MTNDFIKDDKTILRLTSLLAEIKTLIRTCTTEYLLMHFVRLSPKSTAETRFQFPQQLVTESN